MVKNNVITKNEVSNNSCSQVLIDREKLGIEILQAQESERKRIANDIHDSTLQNMTNIMHKTEYCTRLIDMDPIGAKLELQTMVQTIKSTIDEMRSILYNLKPMSIDDLGLVETLERHIYLLKLDKSVNISLHVKSQETKVLSVINISLFRITQEAINNAINHGKADKIKIYLEYDEDYVKLSITDNGRGFETDSLYNSFNESLTGFGLSIMKERVLLLSGEISIDSSINKGTSIFVKVPIRTA